MNAPRTDPRPRVAWPLLLPVVLVALGIHALPQPGFGFQRDELLYFAMGDHLDLFRMQFPPLIAAAARLMNASLGALTKFSIAFLLLGVSVAVLLSPLRRDLLTRWPWIAALIVAVLALPSVSGQVTWHWPFLAQMAALRETQLQRVTPGAFLSAQLLMLGPAAAVMLAGAWSLMFGTRARRFRPAAFGGVAVLVVLLILHGKDYYFAPVHPLLLAAGSVALARRSERTGRAWLVPAVAALLLVGGALLLPMGAPILPREALARYAARLGVSRAVATNYGTVLSLPQDLADMIGWEELTETVASVYRSLPDAGACPRSPSTLIIGGGTMADLQPLCGNVTEVARTSNPWGVEEEQDVPIHVCRDLKQAPDVIWRRLGPDWGERPGRRRRGIFT